MIRHEDINDGALSSKLHKVWCCHCYIPCNACFHPCRKAVSGSKKRYMKKGYDLDLAYITDRIIVHGFPASGIEHLYRNPRIEIRRFMDEHHQENYKMFNFCCEPGRGYDPKIFYGRVERYPFKDHNTPPLETMVEFANSAKAWLDEDPAHVVNMHCKAGKGRAGLMCCVLLVRNGDAKSALEAMDIYDENRVTNRKGLTVTSQRKFVIFYEALWRQVWGVTGNIGDVSAEEAKKLVLPFEPPVKIIGVEVIGLKEGVVKNFKIMIHSITNFGPTKLFDTGLKSGTKPQAECDVVVKANFKVYVQFKPTALGGVIRLVELQHNTFFMSRDQEYVEFGVDQLDIKKKIRPKIGEDVKIRLRLGLGSQSTAGDGSDYSMVKTVGEEEYIGVELTSQPSKGKASYSLVKVTDGQQNSSYKDTQHSHGVTTSASDATTTNGDDDSRELLAKV